MVGIEKDPTSGHSNVASVASIFMIVCSSSDCADLACATGTRSVMLFWLGWLHSTLSAQSQIFLVALKSRPGGQLNVKL